MGTMKRGRVVEGRGSQVRVQFEESDGVVSAWLDVAQTSTMGVQSFRRFREGELVRCYVDRKGESGEALYAIYTDGNPSIGQSEDVVQGVLPDGSTYIWEPGRLWINHASGASATFEGGKITLAAADVDIQGNLNVSGTMSVQGSTDLKDTTINGVTQVGS